MNEQNDTDKRTAKDADKTVRRETLSAPAHTKPLHKIWWLWIPLLLLVVQFFIEASLDTKTLTHIHSETGPHEFAQFIFLLVALFLALAALFRCPQREFPALAGWITLAAICIFYVAGEEVSWGQHIFDWATPEFWENINDQRETNLHNTSSWLDQKPRLLLEIGVIFGGLILPLLMKYKPALVPVRFSLIYPPPQLAVIATIVLALKLVDVIVEDMMGLVIFHRGSEVIELYLYYFVLLYMIVMRRRAARLAAPRPDTPPESL